jgi:hypothetical protein
MKTIIEGYRQTGSTASASGTGDVAWSPASLTAQAQIDAGEDTQVLRATNFGFLDPPDDATIQGVEVKITKQDEDNTNSVIDHSVQLLYNGSPLGSWFSGSPWPGTSTTVTYGAASSTWGASLTGAMVKHSTFGVQIGAGLSSGPQDVDLNISQIEMRIHYAAKDPEPDEKAPPCGDCCDCGCSSHPVRYANGEIHLEAADLAAAGFGLSWGHRRSYSNRLSHHGEIGQGFGWLMSHWPYLIQKTGGAIVFVEDNHAAVWFDSSMGSYTARHGAQHTLTHNMMAQEFTLTKPSGEVYKFKDFGMMASPKGALKSVTSPGGQSISVVSYDTSEHITEVQRSSSSGGSTTVESFKYDYLTSGDNTGRLEYVTLRRQVDGGDWANYRRVKNEFYNAEEAYGHQGDLKRVTIQQWNGSAWDDLEVSMYRYYKDGESGGSRHLLKYVVNPESYERLKAAVSDPLTATNAQVADYADLRGASKRGRVNGTGLIIDKKLGRR